MPKIFISYRRDDSAYPAQSIHETLAAHFGETDVFIDVDHIPIGINFHEYISEAVGKCDVLLAVIGDHWLNAQDKSGGRRLDNPNDMVRIEIEAALSRKIPVVPVLVGNASVPQAIDLPGTLRELTQHQAAEVRAGRDFLIHLDRLVRGIRHTLNEAMRLAAADEAERQSEVQEIKRPPESQSNPGQVASNKKQPVIAVPKPSDIITKSINVKLVLIPAGGFLMGSSDSDKMARAVEKPQHHVEITKPFHLGVYPVTQAEYERVMGDNPSWYKGNDHRPAEGINWFDAVAFCNKLSEVEKMNPFYNISGQEVSIVGGNGYRLPTEAEWEYACRAGSITRWCFGDDESKLKEYGWFDQNSGNITHPVGEMTPNPWGLCDMYGNVWEWCWDGFGSDYYKQSPAIDPSGPIKQGEYRVLRGGSFGDPPSSVSSAYRLLNVPTNRYNDIGFRLARM